MSTGQTVWLDPSRNPTLVMSSFRRDLGGLEFEYLGETKFGQLRLRNSVGEEKVIVADWITLSRPNYAAYAAWENVDLTRV
jgi:hypothetical protein